MKLSVDTILSVFRFLAYLLEKRHATATTNAFNTNQQITALISEREAHVTEAARAAAAAKRLREFIVI